MDEQLELSLGGAPSRPLSVTELVRMVRDTLEANLDEVWVTGEVSNARVAPSNHCYFTLKDSAAAISVVMFNSAFRRLRFRLSDGMQVVVRGRLNIYETRGALQLYAEEIEPRGLGALQLAFEQLKQRLAKEGLFAPERKRQLPFLPHTVGIVTAMGGAALHDMMTILLSRFPNLCLLVCPARVQGAGAADEIAQAIEDLNRDGRSELIIVGRGGGSLEDLWAFNEETVARAIYRSAVPVVSAVGHEIDYTIADFVADRRAPTPSAAAQMVVPAKEELRERLGASASALHGALKATLTAYRTHVGQAAARLGDPRLRLRRARQDVDELADELLLAISARVTGLRGRWRELGARLRAPVGLARGQREELGRLDGRLLQAVRRAIAEHRRLLGALAARLDSLSPLRVLERGYAVVRDARARKVLLDAAAVKVGDELEIRLWRGRLRARTTAREIP